VQGQVVRGADLNVRALSGTAEAVAFHGQRGGLPISGSTRIDRKCPIADSHLERAPMIVEKSDSQKQLAGFGSGREAGVHRSDIVIRGGTRLHHYPVPGPEPGCKELRRLLGAQFPAVANLVDLQTDPRCPNRYPLHRGSAADRQGLQGIDRFRDSFAVLDQVDGRDWVEVCHDGALVLDRQVFWLPADDNS
jgi:hypothetical protein